MVVRCGHSHEGGAAGTDVHSSGAVARTIRRQSSKALERSANREMRVFLSHGTHDNQVGFCCAEFAVRTLEEAGASVDFEPQQARHTAARHTADPEHLRVGAAPRPLRAPCSQAQHPRRAPTTPPIVPLTRRARPMLIPRARM